MPSTGEVVLNVAEAGRTTLLESLAFGHSIFLFKLASPSECEELRLEASAAASSRWETAMQPGRLRMPITSVLETPGQDLCDRLLMRMLAHLDGAMPNLLESLFGNALNGATSCASNPNLGFSPGEPAVNVYGVGGAFQPHCDGQRLTVLLPLSARDSFGGGGTAFWSLADDCGMKSPIPGGNPPTVVIVPPLGTALIFGGQVKHSALPVSSGERCKWSFRRSQAPLGGYPRPCPSAPRSLNHDSRRRHLCCELQLGERRRVGPI